MPSHILTVGDATTVFQMHAQWMKVRLTDRMYVCSVMTHDGKLRVGRARDIAAAEINAARAVSTGVDLVDGAL